MVADGNHVDARLPRERGAKHHSSRAAGDIPAGPLQLLDSPSP